MSVDWRHFVSVTDTSLNQLSGGYYAEGQRGPLT
jgi:hypothetical protein